MNCGAIGYLGTMTNHTPLPSLDSVSLYNPNMRLATGMSAGVRHLHSVLQGAR